MKLFFSSQCLDYNQPGHPESPERMKSTFEYLKKKGFHFNEPVTCGEEDILRVHSKEHLQGIQMGKLYDYDTPVIPYIIDYARLAAGSAIAVSEHALKGETSFSLMRPPGHHATRQRVMGFCYLNNIAIAIAKFVDNNPNQKAAILDIDCHHGNGSEAIFFGNSSVLYISLHQSPLYPGTGLESRENCINFPLHPNTEESDYLKAMEKACRALIDFNPSLLGISAGFDTYRDDPLTQFGLDILSYTKIGEMIDALKKPTFIVMEGGYSRDLPKCVHALIKGFDH
ncbi:histone deacetylase [bacterium]|nr:histone deacetylase [bacterium]RQV98945.1 MAG: histone deacetylase [bacterium]